MISREIVVRPIGLVTEPNKVGQFKPGALARARGARIRAFGTIEAARKWRVVDQAPVVAQSAVYAIANSKHVVFLVKASANWVFVYVKSDMTLSTHFIYPGQNFYDDLTTDGRIGLVIDRDRLIVTTPARSFVLDLHLMPATLPSPRFTGAPQPFLRYYTSSYGSASDTGPVPAQTHVTYVGVNKYVASDGYELLSIPAVPVELANQFATDPAKSVTFRIDSSYDSSGIWEQTTEVYRSRAQSLGYDSGTSKYTPISTGQNHYLTKSVPLLIGVTEFDDNTLQAALGEALYTNTAVGGAASLPAIPPPAKCAASFRGHVFYGHYFDPAKFDFRTPVHWGFLDTAVVSQTTLENSLGWRYSTGCSTVAGSPTISGLNNTFGVVPGQLCQVDASGSSTFANVVSATATTVTIDQNVPNTSASANVTIRDVIEINGSIEAISRPEDLQRAISYFYNVEFDFFTPSIEPSTANLGTQYPNALPSNGVTLRARGSASFTLRATNGRNYSPSLPELDETPITLSGKWVPNGLTWGEENEPENVPPGNYAFAEGSELYGMIGTRDCLWLWTDGGISRLSGTGGSVADGYDWVIDPVDKNLLLAGPGAFCESRDMIYAYTNRGFVSVSSEGNVREISDGRINDLLPGKLWSAPEVLSNTAIWLEADPTQDDIYLRTADGEFWVYNAKTDTFCQGNPSDVESPIAAVYSPRDEKLIGFEASSGQVVASDGTGYEALDLRFQPLFGQDPFEHKHWLSADVTLDAPQDASLSVTFKPNDVVGLASTRTVPTSTTSPYEDSSRVGFTIPRNAPAAANMFAAAISTSESSSAVKLQGVRLRYNTFSGQRRRR